MPPDLLSPEKVDLPPQKQMKNTKAPTFQVVACLLVAGLTSSMGCTAREIPAYARGDRHISAVQIESECAFALNKAASSDPRNVGFPFQIPAEEEAQIVEAEINQELASQFGANRDGLQFGSDTFQALYLISMNLENGRVPLATRIEQLKSAIRLTDQAALLAPAPEQRIAVLARLSAVNQLNRLGAITPLDYQQHVAACAENLQDPQLFLRLFHLFEGSGNAEKAFASLESAILSEMRQSTNKHLPEFEAAFGEAKSRSLFNPEQNAYIQSLFDRYTGVLE